MKINMDPTPWRKQRLLVKDILVHAKKLGSDEIETHVVKIVDVSRKIDGVGNAIKKVEEYQRRLERDQLAQMQAMANEPRPMMVQPSYQSNGFPGQAWGGNPFTNFGGSPQW
jgi:hypothetical protein